MNYMDNSDEKEDLKPIIENIVKMLNESLEELFVSKVLQRLISFGYTIKEEDTFTIAFCIQKVENHIKSSCNISSIPDELIEIAVDRICGEFLFSKKQSGKLDAENGFDIETALKQVQVGDTNITFAVGEGAETLETKLNSLISYLLNAGESDFICYRKIKW